MNTSVAPVTAKIEPFYVAYAPDLGVWSLGDCLEEAVNTLAEMVRDQKRRQRMEEAFMAPTGRPFRCSVCYRRFSARGSLNRHSELEHRRIRQCRNCGKHLWDDEYHCC